MNDMADKKLIMAIKRGIVKAMFDMERYAKRICPVDTGRLRSSIMIELKGNSITLSGNTDYASYIEYGTHRMRPQPFIRPAIHMGVRKFPPERIRQQVAKI